MRNVTLRDIQTVFNMFETVYKQRFVSPSIEEIKMWANRFEECDCKIFMEAIENCLNKYTFPPIIPEVSMEYETVYMKYYRGIIDLINEWDTIKYYYPKNLIDEAAGSYLWNTVQNFPSHSNQLIFMQKVRDKVSWYSANYADEELPKLSDLIQKIEREI